MDFNKLINFFTSIKIEVENPGRSSIDNDFEDRDGVIFSDEILQKNIRFKLNDEIFILKDLQYRKARILQRYVLDIGGKYLEWPQGKGNVSVESMINDMIKDVNKKEEDNARNALLKVYDNIKNIFNEGWPWQTSPNNLLTNSHWHDIILFIQKSIKLGSIPKSNDILYRHLLYYTGPGQRFEPVTDQKPKAVLNYFNEKIHKIKHDNFKQPTNRVSRICWNTEGWVKPSGSKGKSHDNKSHEFKNGYGHEEWLFDIDKLIDNYHYAYLEPIRTKKNAFDGKVFNVGLYTIDGDSNKRYWVGKIVNVEVITIEKAEEVKNRYIQNGWYDKMKNQIKEVRGKDKDFTSWTGGQLFNIRFRKNDIKINTLQLLPPTHPIYKQSRYVFLKDENMGFIDPDKSTDFEFFVRPDKPSDDSIKTSSYQVEPRLVQVKRNHKKIQKLLLEKLRSHFGHEKVEKELPTGNGTQIDIVLKDNKKFIFYEIKTYPSVRYAIREALGQLLEYGYWKKLTTDTVLVIVTDLELDQDSKEYLERLRTDFSISLDYQQLVLESSRLMPSCFTDLWHE